MIPAIPWRLVGYGALAAVLIAVGWRVNSWRQDAQELDRVRQELIDAKDALRVSNEASDGYQKALIELRARRVPTRVVRLCSDPPRVPAAPPRPDGPAAPAGPLPPRAGPDIGRRLYGLTDRCDEIAAQLRALQELHK